MPLTFKQALSIAKGTLEQGHNRDFAPLCAVVLDAGAHPVVVLRDDGASISRPEIATAKAAGCLGMGIGGRELARRAAHVPQFFAALTAVLPKGILPVPGGVLIRAASGELLGAIGVSGDSSDKDEICAIAAIEAAGLKADSGA